MADPGAATGSDPHFESLLIELGGLDGALAPDERRATPRPALRVAVLLFSMVACGLLTWWIGAEWRKTLEPPPAVRPPPWAQPGPKAAPVPPPTDSVRPEESLAAPPAELVEPARPAQTPLPASEAPSTDVTLEEMALIEVPRFSQDSGRWQIQIPISRPVKVRVFELQDPRRIVVDLLEATYPGRLHSFQTPIPFIAQVRIANQERFSRVVLDVSAHLAQPYQTQLVPEGLVFQFGE